MGNADDLLFVHGYQGAQHDHVAGPVHHVEVGQGLAGYLGNGVPHDQPLNPQFLGNPVRRHQHLALEHHAPVAVIH